MERKLIQLAVCLAAFAMSAVAQTTVTTSGTTTSGTVPVFNGTSAVTNSPITVSGSNVGIGTPSPGNALSVNGVINAGGSYFNVLTYNYNGTPTSGIKIQTQIPYTNAAEMPTIIIQGYDFSTSSPIGLILNWYIYGGSFVDYAVASFGSYTPPIQLSDENGYVVIFINDRSYYERFTIQAYAHGMSELPTWFNGWTAVDQAVTGSNTVMVPYTNRVATLVAGSGSGRVAKSFSKATKTA